MLVKLRANMTQTSFLDDTLEKKIDDLEKWMGRLSKQLQFLKAVVDLNNQAKRNEPKTKHTQQDLFVG